MPTVPNWKRLELRVAKLFNTNRTPLSGGNSRHSRSDSLHDDLFISCKYSQKSALQSLYDEENPKAVAEDKLPVLCTFKAKAKQFMVSVASTDLEEFAIKFLKSIGYSVKKTK
jgi:hypothetical protein